MASAAWLVLGSLGWLSYHYYAHLMAAYQIDGIRLPTKPACAGARWPWRCSGHGFGLPGAAWAHLTAYYQYGQKYRGGGTGLGDHRSKVATSTFESLRAMTTGTTAPDRTSAGFALGGAAVTIALASLRFLFLRFPLHPVGYLIATAYWNECPIWGDLFLVWLLKTLILRIGGVRLYRQLIPCFVGLAIGQFFWGGIVWGNMTPFIPLEIAKRYWLPRV